MQVSHINLTINSACEFVCIDTYLIVSILCVLWVFVREYVRMARGLTEFLMCPTSMLLSVSVCGT